jgi:hypothetical protein
MVSEIKRAHTKPNGPYCGVSLVLERCLDKGIDREDLNEIVRGKQVQLLFGFAICWMTEKFLRIRVGALSSTKAEIRRSVLLDFTNLCWQQTPPVVKDGLKKIPDPFRFSA